MGKTLAVLSTVLAVSACAGGRVTEVSPQQIPALEAELQERPNNPDLLLRYGAALYAANQCDSARVVARRGSTLKPYDALGPLVIGPCLEGAGEFDLAVAEYRAYLANHGDRRGADAVRAREMLALREQANRQARDVLARETELTQQPADPQTIAVLPVSITGDSSFLPLGRGLAQMIISDLDLLRQFRMVERLQVGALLAELEFGQADRVDASTAARVGRLLQAGRMVQGLAVIPPDGVTRLEASIVLADGQIVPGQPATGRFEDLLRLEKEVALSIAQQLGYVLSEAERRLILENGTENLVAFLAYSRGLEAEDLGDYSAAAQHYAGAVQADPGFQQARTQYQATAVAPQVQQAAPGQVTTVANQSADPPQPATDPTGSALTSAIYEVSPTQAEGATGTGAGDEGSVNTNTASPPSSNTQTHPSPTATGTIRIVFVLP